MPVVQDGSTLIDLDRHPEEPELARPWRQTALGAVPIRSWLAALLVATLALPLAGGAVPAPALVQLWTVPLATETVAVQTDEDRLYQIEPGDDGPELAAYRLADGYSMWRTRLTPAPGADSRHHLLVPRAGVVMVSRRATADSSGSILGFDPVTGHQLWELLGWSEVTATDEDHLLLSRVPEQGDQEWAFDPPREVLLLDPATGQPVATATVDADTSAVPVRNEAGPQLVTLGADGRLQRIDLVTGEVLAAAEAAPLDQPPAWSVSKEQLVIARTGAVGGVVGYDLGTLLPRWEAAEAVAFTECGPWWCLEHHGDEDARVDAVDPGTGERRWTQRCGLRPDWEACWMWAAEQATDRLWLHRSWVPVEHRPTAGSETGAWLVDTATGVEVAHLGDWRLAQQDTSPRRWAYQVAAVPPSSDVNRVDDLIGPPTRYWLGHLGADLQVRLVGEFEAAVWGLTGEYLVAIVDDRIEVWHVR